MRVWRRSTAVVLVVLGLAGCGEVEDAARGATDAVRDEAGRAASDVAEEAIRGEICRVVDDGRVTGAEVAVLRAAVAGAEGAGLPEALTSAARDVVGTEGRPHADAVRRLEEACRR